MTTSKTPFLTELDKASKAAGIFLWHDFLPPDESGRAFQVLHDGLPWDLTPKLFGERLTQHAYSYERTTSKQGSNDKKSYPSVAYLDQLCQAIEKRFDGEVTDVFCNRFQDPAHRIGWHSDTYGAHIFVLTLGSERNIQFRPKAKLFQKKNSLPVETVRPRAGDLYFMPLQLNNTHDHRVCSTDDQDAGPRLSFVFFFESPKYATDFKIRWRDQVRGYFEGLRE
jgi:hypothetical protein